MKELIGIVILIAIMMLFTIIAPKHWFKKRN